MDRLAELQQRARAGTITTEQITEARLLAQKSRFPTPRNGDAKRGFAGISAAEFFRDHPRPPPSNPQELQRRALANAKAAVERRKAAARAS